ncbi:hypothetical protein WN51_10302 [Melipona quadrifasciata]|uniref:Uncharacterized protein n=1 Tax=Melipona quadrifasciata TaxID=166423 RepID=A0A0N0BI66_9HYME|nr:hypothetical protein WN51_10302 [Melipona quadrifasciata]
MRGQFHGEVSDRSYTTVQRHSHARRELLDAFSISHKQNLFLKMVKLSSKASRVDRDRGCEVLRNSPANALTLISSCAEINISDGFSIGTESIFTDDEFEFLMRGNLSWDFNIGKFGSRREDEMYRKLA